MARSHESVAFKWTPLDASKGLVRQIDCQLLSKLWFLDSVIYSWCRQPAYTVLDFALSGEEFFPLLLKEAPDEN